SARNVLHGTVKSVEPGAVNAEVVIELAGGQEIVSIITKESAEKLALAPGKEVSAGIKSLDVMVMVGGPASFPLAFESDSHPGVCERRPERKENSMRRSRRASGRSFRDGERLPVLAFGMILAALVAVGHIRSNAQEAPKTPQKQTVLVSM